jgi:hypothetical protein
MNSYGKQTIKRCSSLAVPKLAEERSKLESLTSSTFPIAFKLPDQPSESA